MEGGAVRTVLAEGYCAGHGLFRLPGRICRVSGIESMESVDNLSREKASFLWKSAGFPSQEFHLQIFALCESTNLLLDKGSPLFKDEYAL